MPPLSLRTDGHFSGVKAYVESIGCGGFAVRETVAGENEHWHWLLETDRKIQAVRTGLSRAVPELKGNGKYSLTEVKDIEKYERYLVKGESEGEGFELAWRNSLKYDDDKLEELHSQYWEANRKMKKRGGGSMLDWVVDQAKLQEVSYGQRSKLARIYIKELGQRGKPINLFSLKANLNSVQLALCPDDTILNQLCDQVDQF